MSEPRPPIRRLRERLEYRNPWVRVFFDDVDRAGKPGQYTRIEDGPGGARSGVVIIPRDARRRLLFVHIYRYPVAAWLWELPRGYGEPAETGTQSAARELAEEVGLHAETYKELGEIYPNSGLLASGVAVVLADRVRGRIALERTEAIDASRWFTLPEALAEAETSLRCDGISLAALALLVSHEGLLADS